MKMSEDSSATYYHGNQKKTTKKAPERYQSLSKEEKNMNNTKISQKLKNKSRKSIEEKKV